MPKPCGRCGRQWATDAWRALDLVERITSDQVRAHLTSWAESNVIEVRACTCGQGLACKVGRATERAIAG